MAKRFYLPNTGTAVISPSFNGAWEQTGQADRIMMVNKLTQSVLDPLTDKTVTVPITTSQQILVRQFVSEPLEAQVFPSVNQIDIYIKVSEDAVTTNANLAWVVTVVSNDGSTLRGTLASMSTAASEFPTTAASLHVSGGLNSVTAQMGDRIVFEIGVDAVAPTASGTATMKFGDSAGVDYSGGNDTADKNPFIDFFVDVKLLSSSWGNIDPYLRTGNMSRNERAT